MKWSLAAFGVCTLALTAQDQPAGQLKHLSIPTRTNGNPISVAALAIEREGEYPAIIHLRGASKSRHRSASRPARGARCIVTGISCCMPIRPTSTKARARSMHAARSPSRAKTNCGGPLAHGRGSDWGGALRT